MTLGELLKELEAQGIKSYGKKWMGDLGVTLYLAYEKPVFPFASVPIYPVVFNSDDESQELNSEVVAAIFRRFMPTLDGD